MFKKVLSTLLSLFITVLCPLTAFASGNSSLDTEWFSVASGSDASQVYDDSLNTFQDSSEYASVFSLDSLLYSDSTGVSNTVADWSSVKVFVYGPDNYLKLIGYVQNGNGVGVFGKEFDVPDGQAISGFILYCSRSAFPNSGKWKSQISVQTSANLQANGLYAFGYVERTNATELGGELPQSSHDFITPDFYTATYNINNQSLTNINYFFPYTFPLYGHQSLNFTVACEYTNYESGDINEPVAPLPDVTEQNNTIIEQGQQQVEQGETIIELIKNTIQTISSQLTAFWNQLAGEFTNLYNKMNQQHAEQLEADRNNTEDIIAAEESNTTNIINNNNANTDKLANGYDNSGMNSDNNRLNGSLTEYDQAEDNLMKDVNEGIGNIDFDFNFDSTLSVISTVSDFLQGIYERSGGFQIVINVCLILSLASCAVGLYRLKGGG